MKEPEGTIAAAAKTTAVAGSGLVVWGFSLNEWAAICSIVLVLITISEKIGLTAYVKELIQRDDSDN